jgi:hypothetical protein
VTIPIGSLTSDKQLRVKPHGNLLSVLAPRTYER